MCKIRGKREVVYILFPLEEVCRLVCLQVFYSICQEVSRFVLTFFLMCFPMSVRFVGLFYVLFWFFIIKMQDPGPAMILSLFLLLNWRKDH